MFADTIDAVEEYPRYRLIGRQPLSWQWLDDLPYSELQAMRWNSEQGFYEIQSEYPRLFVTIVDCESLDITEVYQDRHTHYAMTFNEARGTDGQPHPVRAYWIAYD
jgi:hypothetical protein